MYTTDPNDAKKQVPKARPQSAYGKATTPSAQIITARPNFILINLDNVQVRLLFL